MSERLPGTVLDAGRVVPGTALRLEPGGGTLSLWDFRHRTAVVLCVLHPDCQPCDRFEAALRDRAGEDVATAGARIVGVRDPGSEGRRRLLGGSVPPVVIVVDRYGAAWQSYPAEGHHFPEPTEVAATVWHLATMCPECGVSTWD